MTTTKEEEPTTANALDSLLDTPSLAPSIKAKTKGKKARQEVELGGDFDLLAGLSIVLDAVKSVQTQLKGDMTQRMADWYTEKMLEIKTKPDSITIKGELATALGSLRKRGSNLKVSPEIAEELIAMGVPIDEAETVSERYVINPEIEKDQAVLQAVAEAIKGHPKLEGVTVIMKQQKESHYAVSEDTIPTLARLCEDQAKLRLLIEKVATFSLGRFKFTEAKGGEAELLMALDAVREAGILPGEKA
jgi:hypothetical protein